MIRVIAAPSIPHATVAELDAEAEQRRLAARNGAPVAIASVADADRRHFFVESHDVVATLEVLRRCDAPRITPDGGRIVGKARVSVSVPLETRLLLSTDGRSPTEASTRDSRVQDVGADGQQRHHVLELDEGRGYHVQAIAEPIAELSPGPLQHASRRLSRVASATFSVLRVLGTNSGSGGCAGF